MTEAEPAEGAEVTGGPGLGAGISWRTALLRVFIAIALVAAIAVSGVAIYRNQRDRAGMPVVLVPAPRASAVPTVEDGITLLQTQVSDDPEDAGAWRNLGWSYFQRGAFTQSADALRHATRLDPTSARTLSFLGEALLQARRPEGHMPHEARLAFDEAIKLDPKDARARYYRAVGWDLNGQHRRAINAWFALLKDTPADAPYASDIRAVIRTVGARHHIKVEKRLAEAQFAPPNGSASVPTTATAPAASPHGGKTTVPEPAGERMRAVEDVPRPTHSAGAPGS